jgi:hypothetical protein
MSVTDSTTTPPPQPGTHTVHVVHPAPQGRFQGLGVIALMIGIVVVLGVTVVFMWQLTRTQPQSLSVGVGEQGDVASLRDRLASDEARIAVLERSGSAGGLGSTAAADLAALSARVGKLEGAPDPQAAARLDDLDRRLSSTHTDLDLRIAALERNALGSDMPARVATVMSQEVALEARVAMLENVEPNVTMKRAAAEIALVNLVRASATAGPFASELATFRALMPNAVEAGELAPFALHGVPTQATLAQQFPDVAARMLEAENRARATTWLGRLWANIGNLIVIRRTGERKGEDSESILARAGTRLNGGDLDGAVKEMMSLKGAARASAQGWLAQAQARQAIQHDTILLAARLSKFLNEP